MCDEKVICDEHGESFATYVCEHLIGSSDTGWHSSQLTSDNKWPDAWCDQCHTAYTKEGEWNETTEIGVDIKLLCHHCYERTKAKCHVHYL